VELTGLLNNPRIAPWSLCNKSYPYRREQLVSYLLLAFSVADSRLQLNVIAVTQIRTPQTYIFLLPETFKIYTETPSILSFRLRDLQNQFEMSLNLSAYCDVEYCCYAYSPNMTWVPIGLPVSNNSHCHCQFQGNADIAGPGVCFVVLQRYFHVLTASRSWRLS
jgi:hypothetical protein